MSKPTLSKAALRAELEAALANYHGPITLCPPAPAPEPDREGLDLNDEDPAATRSKPALLPLTKHNS